MGKKWFIIFVLLISLGKKTVVRKLFNQLSQLQICHYFFGLLDVFTDHHKADNFSNGCFFTHKKSDQTEMTTENGYWKLTTENDEIKFMRYVIGFKTTFHFYLGKAPSGIQTKWVIREYKFNSTTIPRLFLPQDIKQKVQTSVNFVIDLFFFLINNEFLTCSLLLVVYIRWIVMWCA